MRYERGDITYIKINNRLLQVKIVKEVKPYHGDSYYVPGEVRYFVQTPRERILKSYLESDIIEWEREFKLKELGI
jgi:hypothetical protein